MRKKLEGRDRGILYTFDKFERENHFRCGLLKKIKIKGGEKYSHFIYDRVGVIFISVSRDLSTLFVSLILDEIVIRW